MGWLLRFITGRMGISRFLQSTFNIILVRRLPKIITRGYIYALGHLFMDLKPGLKERTNAHLQAALAQGVVKPVKNALNQTLEGICAHYYEKLFIAFFKFSKVCRFLRQRVAIKRYDLLDDALSKGRGIILVTGHYGAVEFLPLTLALQGYPVTMLLRFKTPRLKAGLTERANQVNIQLVDVDEDPKVIFTALKALKANRILITECDEFEKWCADKRKRVKFLGASMHRDRSLDMLQRRSKAPAVVGLVHRQKKERYQLQLHPLDVSSARGRFPGIGEQALEILEQYIVASPNQWYQWKDADFLLGNNVTEAPLELAPGGNMFEPLPNSAQ